MNSLIHVVDSKEPTDINLLIQAVEPPDINSLI